MNKTLLPESLLKEAVIKACELENAAYDKLIASEDDPVFSDEFRKNIKKLMKESDDTEKADIIEYPFKGISKKSLRVKIALIAIIIMMFGSITVIAVEPLREKAYKIVETLFSDHTDVSFEEISEEAEEDNTDSQTLSFNPADFPQKLKWVPEGFVLDSEYEVPEVFSLVQSYVNGDKQIDYSQMAMEYAGDWSVSSDGTKADEIIIDNEKAYLITDADDWHSILLPKQGYIYNLGGNVETEILIKCFESVFDNESDNESK